MLFDIIHLVQKKKKSCSNACAPRSSNFKLVIKITGLESCIRVNKIIAPLSSTQLSNGAIALHSFLIPGEIHQAFFLMQLAHTLSWWGLNPNPMLQICLRIFPPKTDVLRMQPEGDIQMPELPYAAPFTAVKHESFSEIPLNI